MSLPVSPEERSNLLEASVDDLEFLARKLGQSAQTVESFRFVSNDLKVEVIKVVICGRKTES